MVFINIPASRSRDFTLEKYRDLCSALQENYTTCTVRDYLSGNAGIRVAILRHDVDRRITNALKMAELEQGMGIRSTYYFRYPYTFRPEIIRKITDLGHEVGYHYEVLSKTRGDYEKAIALFRSELDAFRKVCQVDTICMHGQPLSSLDNRDLWKKYRWQDYGLIGEAYLSMGTVDYFSDTGRNWNGKNNLRDFLTTNTIHEKLDSTDDLIKILIKNWPQTIYIVTHSERWSSNISEWIVWSFLDYGINIGKRLISVIRAK